jgi:hypothetical protein
MRKASGAVIAMIMAIALYFMLFWGFDALRVLSSPSFGLDDPWRSQFVFGIGRMLGLGPFGLIKLAAFFGVMKLAVAGVCAVHVLDRVRCITRGHADSEVLEAGLILVVLISIAAVGPALWSHNVDLVREQIIQLLLAGLAVALTVIERGSLNAATPDAIAVEAKTSTPQGATWFTPWR